MRRDVLVLCLAGLIGTEVGAGVPRFKVEEIDRSLKIGYGVVLADVAGDAKLDIVVADKERVVAFENPSWKAHVLLPEGKTVADHVAIDAADIDGDGQVELALAAGWRPPDTNAASTLQWLKRGKRDGEAWAVHPIAYDAPTLHRVRFADVTGDGKVELVVSPLHGKGVVAKDNFAGDGPRLGYLDIPADLGSGKWEFHEIEGGKHVMHGIQPTQAFKGVGLLTASYEGVGLHTLSGKRWTKWHLGNGDQADPAKPRGSSEVRLGKEAGKDPFVATVEPFHGNKVVVYSGLRNAGNPFRDVIDDKLKSGHALACADLDGDGTDEIVLGFRDPYSGTISYGLNAYHLAGDRKWEKTVIDDGGIAVEDLVCADLNSDGKVDIVAVGRATKNVRIYWNEGK